MSGSAAKSSSLRGILWGALFIAGCSHAPAQAPTAACPVLPKAPATSEAVPTFRPPRDLDVEDLRRIPQKLSEVIGPSSGTIEIEQSCRSQLVDEFRRRYFHPWTSAVPLFEHAETVSFMKQEANGEWYGVNEREVKRQQLQEILHNCALESFPSRNDTAIAVAPAHLRGLPTPLPLYKPNEGPPFDMLSYPQVKLNEPLRILHASRDGAWLFVETGYTNGWLESRDVALVDRAFISSWMQPPHLVITRDKAPVEDGRGVGTFQTKIGTVLPLARGGNGWWEVRVASAGEGGRVESRVTRVEGQAAAPFPIEFNEKNLGLIGDQLLGQPYGWGELYDLRDCSALLRDFFMPFGIWLPRTSADQIASAPHRQLGGLPAADKEALIKKEALPFLTLIYKPGHIMLYAGKDPAGRPLLFHDAWSVHLTGGARGRKQIIGFAVVTTMEPGKELGLWPGGSLLEKATELATITERCNHHPKKHPGRQPQAQGDAR